VSALAALAELPIGVSPRGRNDAVDAVVTTSGFVTIAAFHGC
jgi:hypothetical protein